MDYQLNPTEQEKLNRAVEEAVTSHERVQMEKDFCKDVADRMKEELDIKTADFNALVNERYKHKSQEAVDKHEAVVAFNELLVNNTKKTSTAAQADDAWAAHSEEQSEVY